MGIKFLTAARDKELSKSREQNLKPLSEKTDVDSCKLELLVSNNGWRLKADKTIACERQKANIARLGRRTRMYLEKRLD